jgi:hypothetical protein
MKTTDADVPRREDDATFENLEWRGEELSDDLLEAVTGGMLVSDPKRPPTYLGGEPGCWDPIEIPF